MKVEKIRIGSAALYMNAAKAGVNAICILTVTDCKRTGEMATTEEREKARRR